MYLNAVAAGCGIQPLSPVVGSSYNNKVILPRHQHLVMKGDILGVHCEVGVCTPAYAHGDIILRVITYILVIVSCGRLACMLLWAAA